METRLRSVAVIGLTFLSLACAQDESGDQPAAQATPAEQTAATMAGDSMGGMGGMGMSGMQMGAGMMAHMQSMQAMHGDSLMQMVPAHRQMLGNMIDQMDREIQAMNKPADPARTALADSLRSDMTRMTQMSAAEMDAFRTAHHDRITRLMEMHRTMMGM